MNTGGAGAIGCSPPPTGTPLLEGRAHAIARAMSTPRAVLLAPLLGVFLGLFPLASTGLAQGIGGAARIGLETSALSYESVTLDGTTATTVNSGIGLSGFGLHLGGATEHVELGVNLRLTNQTSEVEGSDVEFSTTHLTLLPTLRAVLGSRGSAVRPFIGGSLGLTHTAYDASGDEDGWDADAGDAESTSTLLAGPVVGIHGFVGDHVSLDLTANAFRVVGLGSVDATGYSLSITAGISAWLGGATNAGARVAQPPAGMRPRPAWRPQPYAPPPRARQPTPRPLARRGPPRGRVLRSVDPASKRVIVRAEFRHRGATIRLYAAPQDALDRVHVQLDAASYAVDAQGCDAIAVQVDRRPIPIGPTQRQEAGRLRLYAPVRFVDLQPLARAHSQFGVVACGRRWDLEPTQVRDLQAFLRAVSEVAHEVQSGKLPAPAAAPAVPAQSAPAPAAEPGSPSAAPPAAVPTAAAPAAPTPEAPTQPSPAAPATPAAPAPATPAPTRAP